MVQSIAVRTVRSPIGLIALLVGSGVLHFVVPEPYRRIIPAPLRPWDAWLVAISGAVELLCAVLLAIPRTRPVGGLLTAALLVAVFPANVQMALDSRTSPSGGWLSQQTATWLRLPLQIPLVLWAIWFYRKSPRSG